MMFRILFVFVIVAGPVFAAAPPEVAKTMRGAALSGEADVKFWGFNLYRAQLWRAGDGFALSLTYKRSFTAKELADASVKEIARMERADEASYTGLGPLLEKCFANVQEGDRITGAATGADSATFFYNGAKRCDVTYPKFRDRFFGIWLGERTRDPKSRDRLLGRAQ